MVYTVGRMSITHLVMLFAIYLVLHLYIAVKEKKLKTRIEEGVNTLGIIKEHKIMNFLTNWFPGIFVVFLLAIFYFV